MRKSVKITIYLMVVLLLQELLFRWACPLPELEGPKRSDYMPGLFQENPVATVPFEKRSWASYPDTVYDFVHRLNGYGFRDKRWHVNKDSEHKRIFMLGDSFVEGLMAEQDATIPATLQSYYGDGTQVMNAGILGIGMEEYIRLITDLVPIYRPDEVLLVLYANDLSGKEFVEPDEKQPWTKQPWYIPRVYVLLNKLAHERPIPFKWSGVRPFIPSIPDKGNFWTDHEALYMPRVSEKVAGFMRAGKFNIARTNWVLKEESKLKQPFQVRDHLKYLKQYVAEYDCQMTVVYIPSRHQVSTYYYPFELEMCRLECPPKLDLTIDRYQIHRTLLMEDCQFLGIPFIDTYPSIRAVENSGRHLYWDYDDHMREQGYSLVAKTIFDQLSGN